MKRTVGDILGKIGMKKKALKIYFFFINSWTDGVKSTRKTILPLLANQRSRKGIYAIDLDSDWLGLGARIVKTLEILLYCDEHKLMPAIRYNYLEKNKTEHDYFGELFRYHRPVSGDVRYTAVRDVDELGWKENYNQKLKLGFARQLFDKYLGIRPDILEETDRFVAANFGGRKILGLHYRGTDKAGEAPLVAKEQLLQHIRTVLTQRPQLELIFVSTDDEKIISFLQQSDLHLPVIFRQDAVRSKDGDQFHRKTEISKSVVHRDAIVNMLLLSRTDFLLKTASILSDCSVIFNPALEVRVISFPHSDNLTWWPATEIKRSQEKTTYAIAETR